MLIEVLESKGYVIFDSYREDVSGLENLQQRGRNLSNYLESSLSLLSSYNRILEIAEKRTKHISATAHSPRYRWDQLHYLALPFPLIGAIESSTPHPTLDKWPLIPTDLPPAPYNVLDFWNLEGDRIETSHFQWITEILIGWSLSAGVYPNKGKFDCEQWIQKLEEKFLGWKHYKKTIYSVADNSGESWNPVIEDVLSEGNFYYEDIRQLAKEASAAYRKSNTEAKAKSGLSIARIAQELLETSSELYGCVEDFGDSELAALERRRVALGLNETEMRILKLRLLTPPMTNKKIAAQLEMTSYEVKLVRQRIKWREQQFLGKNQDSERERRKRHQI